METKENIFGVESLRSILEEFAESYLTRYDPNSNNIRSFDEAMIYEFPKLIEEYSPIQHIATNDVTGVVEVHEISLTDDLRIVTPCYKDTLSKNIGFYPEHAENVHQDYTVNFTCTARYTVNGVEMERIENFSVVRVPCMVGSKLCNRSIHIGSSIEKKIPDGCFVVGSLKVMPPLKRAVWNIPIIRYIESDEKLAMEVRSCHYSRQSFSTYNISLYLSNSGPDFELLDKKLLINLSFFGDRTSVISASVIFQLYGWNLEKVFKAIKFHAGDSWNTMMEAMLMVILTESEMLPTAEEIKHNTYNMRHKAMQIVGKKSGRISDRGNTDEHRASLMATMDREFLPQVGIPTYEDGTTQSQKNYKKCMLLASYIRDLIMIELGMIEYLPRDHFVLCRMDSVGTLLASHFRQNFLQNMKQAKKEIQKCLSKKKMPGIEKCYGNGKTSSRVRFGVATGMMGARGSVSARVNVSQHLQSANAQSALGHMSLFYTTINKEGKHVSLRMLQTSHAFKICPTTTPDGDQCGLVTTGVAGFLLSKGSDSSFLSIVMCTHPDVLPIDMTSSGEHFDTLVKKIHLSTIMVNGTAIGYLDTKRTSNEEYYRWFVRKRQLLEIDCFASMSYTGRKIHICCDRDRVCRFVVRISEIHRLKQFSKRQPSPVELVHAGVGIILDSNEELVVSITAELTETTDITKYEYIEIDPCCMFSIGAASIPFANSNQGPRNTYQMAISKAAAGQYLNQDIITPRFELTAPQRPLISTMMSRAFDGTFDRCGVNVIVAIMNYKGYPQEDCGVIDKAFIDSNGLSTTIRKVHFDITTKNTSSTRNVYGPLSRKKTVRMKPADYSNVQEDGMPGAGAQVKNGDIVISKARLFSKQRIKEDPDGPRMMCESIVHKGNTGYVDRKVFAMNSDWRKVRKVAISSALRIEVGDKLSSRHGQKFTVGAIIPHEDMPFDPNTGVVPSITLNPTMFPSRMTAGMWKEMAISCLAAMQGTTIDGTAFRKLNRMKIKESFNALGMHDSCSAYLIDGRTGETTRSKIFYGPVYIHRLTQRSASKIHARARGPRNIQTWAPTEGKSKHGGQRIGLMERDSIIAHGAAAVVHSLMFIHSDISVSYMCHRCGMAAIANKVLGKYYCPQCGPKSVVKVTIPRAIKVLEQELNALGITLRWQISKMIDQAEEAQYETSKLADMSTQFHQLEQNQQLLQQKSEEFINALNSLDPALLDNVMKKTNFE